MGKWFNIGVAGLLLTIAGLIWNASAKLTRLEASIAELRKADEAHDQWINRIVWDALDHR